MQGASGASTSLSGGSNSSPATPGRETRRGHPERPPLRVQLSGPAPRVVRIRRKGAPERRNAAGSKGEDFVPWVPTESEEPRDLEEEERRERMTVLLDRYAARKRKRQVVSSGKSDPATVHSSGPSLPATDGLPVTDGSSEDPAIIIPYSPELEPVGGAEPKGRPVRTKRGCSGSASTPIDPSFRSRRGATKKIEVHAVQTA